MKAKFLLVYFDHLQASRRRHCWQRLRSATSLFSRRFSSFSCRICLSSAGEIPPYFLRQSSRAETPASASRRILMICWSENRFFMGMSSCDPDPKSCSIQKQNFGMINTPLKRGGADEKVTIHRRADCLCPEEAELGTSVPDVCRKLGISDARIFTDVYL